MDPAGVELSDLLLTGKRTELVIERLEQLLLAPICSRLTEGPMPIVTQDRATGCPCQFLVHQRFEHPAKLRSNVQNVIDGARAKRGKPSPGTAGADEQMVYLGVTAYHRCSAAGSDAIGPELWWGFAVETPSTFKFVNGSDGAFKDLNSRVGIDRKLEISFRPVPNLSSFRRAALGRSVAADELRSEWTVDQVLTTIASDLTGLYSALTR